MFKKGSYITSSIGILLIIGLGVNIWFNQGISLQDVLLGLAALGFIETEDSKTSKLKNMFKSGIGGNSGDPGEEEEPPGRPKNG